MKKQCDKIYLYPSPLTRSFASRVRDLSHNHIASSRNLEKLSFSLAFLNIRDPGKNLVMLNLFQHLRSRNKFGMTKNLVPRLALRALGDDACRGVGEVANTRREWAGEGYLSKMGNPS